MGRGVADFWCDLMLCETPGCGKEFAPINGKQTHCSKLCGEKHWRIRHPRPKAKKRCRQCGIEFILESTGQRFCCKSCKKASESATRKRVRESNLDERRKREREWARRKYGRFPRSQTPMLCQMCGESFLSTPQAFVCKGCAPEYRRREALKAYYKNNPPKKRHCQICSVPLSGRSYSYCDECRKNKLPAYSRKVFVDVPCIDCGALFLPKRMTSLRCHICIKAKCAISSKEWANKNKSRVRERQSAWKKKNGARAMRQWRAKNKAKYNERARLQMRKYRSLYPERFREIARRYASKNKDKINARDRVRHGRKRSQERRFALWAQLRRIGQILTEEIKDADACTD